MADVLSAEALITAVIAILYSLWYPDIERVLAIPWRDFRADRLKAIKAARRALLGRALPLVVVSALPAAVFAPDVVTVLTASFRPGASYDSVDAAFIAVYILTFVLLGIAVEQGVRLARWHSRLDRKD